MLIQPPGASQNHKSFVRALASLNAAIRGNTVCPPDRRGDERITMKNPNSARFTVAIALVLALSLIVTRIVKNLIANS